MPSDCWGRPPVSLRWWPHFPEGSQNPGGSKSNLQLRGFSLAVALLVAQTCSGCGGCWADPRLMVKKSWSDPGPNLTFEALKWSSHGNTDS